MDRCIRYLASIVKEARVQFGPQYAKANPCWHPPHIHKEVQILLDYLSTKMISKSVTQKNSNRQRSQQVHETLLNEPDKVFDLFVSAFCFCSKSILDLPHNHGLLVFERYTSQIAFSAFRSQNNISVTPWKLIITQSFQRGWPATKRTKAQIDGRWQHLQLYR